MQTYWMTYRLADNGQFIMRKRKLGEILNSVAHGSRWSEPPMFCIFRSKFDIDKLVDLFRPAIDAREDILLLAMPEHKVARVLGCPQEVSFYGLVPYAEDA